jgi:hypothetical protein
MPKSKIMNFFLKFLVIFAILYVAVSMLQGSPYTMSVLIVWLWKPLLAIMVLFGAAIYIEKVYYKFQLSRNKK